MMLDLDHFKSVNDNYGHAVGDTTLKHFAKILSEIAPEEKMIVGRWGGEEFVIVCRDKDEAKAAELAEKIRQKVDQYLFPEIAHITCSIGLTELKPEDDFTKAFDRIDKAVYASKEGGRNKVTIL
jgi:diguanylate cyclase (GGDEF)-like protein